MPVLGMGGLFFRAHDPDALAIWYRETLGVGAGCVGGAGEASEWHWMTQGGPMVFAPFAADTDYFAADSAFMVNFRVSDLDDMLDRLRSADIEVSTKVEWDDPHIGRFARLHDPEGNAVELWEPPSAR